MSAIPLRSQSETAPPRTAGVLPLSAAAWIPSASGPVPWLLDRLDSRQWGYDGRYTASNFGSGVNIYLVSPVRAVAKPASNSRMCGCGCLRIARHGGAGVPQLGVVCNPLSAF